MTGSFRYMFHLIFHPLDGFYDLKHEKRGSMRIAVIFFLLLAFSAVIKRQFSEYLFNPVVSADLNLPKELALSVGPYLLWCVSNWCFTSLMDGEGSMADIVCATGYALPPAIFANFGSTALSWFLVSEEATYLYLVQYAGLIWTLLLVFFGMLVTHQYSLGKSIATAVLSLIGMMLLLFLLLLLFYLGQQLAGFVSETFTELAFRLDGQ